MLASTYARVNARLQALRFRSNQDEEKWDAAVNEHEQMVAALQKRDGAAMRKVLTLHLNNKRDVVIAQLRASALQGGEPPRLRQAQPERTCAEPNNIASQSQKPFALRYLFRSS